MTPSPFKLLRFLWWNVQDFGHFDPARRGVERWPESQTAYESKRQRVEALLRRLSRGGHPHLLAFAEITDQALRDVRDRAFPGYVVHELSGLYQEPDFRLGVIYDPAAGFGDEDFLAVSNVPDTARPMMTLDWRLSGQRIRFYVCHWTARFKPQSEKWRSLSAHALDLAAYDFIHPESATREARHVVILGDLNEEPFGILESWLYASRDRRRAQGREHYSDQPIRRLRLYNCGWRLLGERFAHPVPSATSGAAGSYYWREERSWHTYDQVLVSGGLLGNACPYLDEGSVRIACGPNDLPADVLAGDGLPCKFAWNSGNPVGLSDHLPICGTLVLS